MEANVKDPIIPNPSGGMNTDQSALPAEPVDEEHNRRRLFISGAAALAVPILGMYAYLEFAGG
jgi:hypothetical protein